VVLVDTSVWIEYLDRVNPMVESDMDELLRAGRVVTAGLVIAELRQGCRRPEQGKAMTEALGPLDYLEADHVSWLRAGELAADGASRGLKLETGDCLLAAIALREQCEIFTLDHDFERIPHVKLYRVRPN
jgi:predicted nucleic acid-binding protein